MGRGKREKDFFSFFFPLSMQVVKRGFDHSFSRPLSQLGSAPKRRGNCHAPGVSQGTAARCTAMETDHTKPSTKIFSPWLTDGQETWSFPSGERRRSRTLNERLSKKRWWEGTLVIAELEGLGNSTVSTQDGAVLHGSGAHQRLQGRIVRIRPSLHLRRSTQPQ